MQFDNSRFAYDSNDSSNRSLDWNTEHQIIKETFEKAGYELPEIVYWYVSKYQMSSFVKNSFPLPHTGTWRVMFRNRLPKMRLALQC